MTTEQTYTKYIRSNCKNTNIKECEIRTKIDNTTYCRGYTKGDTVEGYKKPIYRTAKLEKTLMGLSSSSWGQG